MHLYKITLLSNLAQCNAHSFTALHPYKITLLSNNHHSSMAMVCALHPYKFTLLSNDYFINTISCLLCSPTKLHYSQTCFNRSDIKVTLCTPTKLHYSQTIPCMAEQNTTMLCTPTKLHYSQTKLNITVGSLMALYPYKITLLSNLKYLRKTVYEPFVQFCKNICYIFNMVVLYKKKTPAYLVSLFVGYSSFVFI